MNFGVIKNAVKAQFTKMIESNTELYTVQFDKDTIWATYLNAFPEGTNNLFRERTEHDCVCCRHYIQRVGAVVAITDKGLESVWDVDVKGPYGTVAKALAKYVKSQNIDNVFRHWEKSAGTDMSVSHNEDTREVEQWSHFHIDLPSKYVMSNDTRLTFLSEHRGHFDALKRSMADLTLDAGEITLELIDQGSLYRGEEMKPTVKLFLSLKKECYKLPGNMQDLFCWKKSVELKGACRIRKAAIGTLLEDLSKGVELEEAVKAFERIVAPENYKRPKAIVTKKMLAAAEDKVKELDLMPSLGRRYAVAGDISAGNVIYVDRNVKTKMKDTGNIFEELSEEVANTVNPKSLDKVEEVSVEHFMENIVPKAKTIELMVENKHETNFVSVIAPKDAQAQPLFKWNNPFSWAYKGEVADSNIKENVKRAGGSVTGELRCSLQWYSKNDLDLHLIEPCGHHIYFSHMDSKNRKGCLDIDDTIGGTRKKPAVENITWQNKADLQEGKYKVYVKNFSGSNTNEPGFDFEMEFMGDIYNMSYKKPVSRKENVTCVEFKYTHKGGVEFIGDKHFASVSRKVWNVDTEAFNRVSMIMNSPNHWDGNKTGNRHWFFILEKCNSGESARGFFNEFLREDLRVHRKVFETLGSRLRAEESGEQLSGLGFSSTVRNQAVFKVSGSFNRMVKVKF